MKCLTASFWLTKFMLFIYSYLLKTVDSLTMKGEQQEFCLSCDKWIRKDKLKWHKYRHPHTEFVNFKSNTIVLILPMTEVIDESLVSRKVCFDADCRSEFEDRQDLWEHLQRVHGVKRKLQDFKFQCNNCKAVFEDITAHLISHKKDVFCHDCTWRFHDTKTYVDHASNIHKKQFFLDMDVFCPMILCNVSKDDESMADHFSKNHPNVCMHCLKTVGEGGLEMTLRHEEEIHNLFRKKMSKFDRS